MLKSSLPFVDLRGRTPIDLLRAYPDKAHALIRSAHTSYGWLSKLVTPLVLPLLDKRSHSWLKRARNPYLYEIESFADVLHGAGMYTLNLSYEWACTGGAYRTGESVTLLRVLDWPLEGLGRHAMIVLQQGRAGDFYNMTWPGMAGMVTGMAPGRFAGALHQAPMRRHGRGLFGDWLTNRILAGRQRALPPSHLLRQVFEQADSYETARKMLSTTPLALPAIFVLSGTRPGQGCVIERLENNAEITDLGPGQQITAANHFTGDFAAMGKGWMARGEDSSGRLRQSCALHGHDLQAPHFDWLHGPIINPLTRLAVIADAASGRLMVQGYEGMTPATEMFILPGTPVRQEEEYADTEVV